MPRVIKVFDASAQALAALPGVRLLQDYPAFRIVEVDGDAAATAVLATGLTEDISALYTLTMANTGAAPIDTGIPRVAADGSHEAHPAYGDQAALAPGAHHYIVQFVGPIQDAWLAAVAATGAEVVEPYQHFAIIVRATADEAGLLSQLGAVRWVGHLPYAARLIHEVDTLAAPPAPGAQHGHALADAYTVEFFGAAQAHGRQGDVAAAGFTVVEEAPGSALLVVETAAPGEGSLRDKLLALAQVHGVKRIGRHVLPMPSTDQATRIIGSASVLTDAAGLGLSGAGEVVAMCDTGLDSGDPAAIHPDFAGRVLALESYPISPSYASRINNPGADDGPADRNRGHGTHTAGALLGDGTASAELPNLAGPVRGLAYKAQVIMQAVEQYLDWKPVEGQTTPPPYSLAGLPSDLKVLYSAAYGKGARIHSNSWGGGTKQAYNSYCTDIDTFIWNNPDFCIVFSAGNDGSDGDGDGRIDPGSVTPPGTAKNCITVGACANNRRDINITNGAKWGSKAAPVDALVAGGPDQMAPFSSRGPTQDGRIKPDVVAPGTFILSTRSQRLASYNGQTPYYAPATPFYMYESGTSTAAPLVAGAITLIREYLRTQVGLPSPSAALLKAALIAGAVPLGGTAPGVEDGPLPDINQGFGRVHLDTILAPAPPLRATFLDGNGVATGDLYQYSLQVAADGSPLRVVMAYSDYPGASLVNNLNLVLRGPDGSTLTGNAGLGGQGSNGQSLDSANNVEAIAVSSAAAGIWTVQVVGANVPHDRSPSPWPCWPPVEKRRRPQGRRPSLSTCPDSTVPNTSPGSDRRGGRCRAF
ncbi:S8 family serine peptidase [Nitrospirillum sp. BR 11163]|uniref:S8 family serine peptidase n=1 Tax=Nitrospirillum sp. BR 11163 TaxID=3104323 RepID=UPI002AFF3C2D|nr:S8 family serine peptidase [Nitrospirillum sp. BR 11163]MEA1672226.1 S8 family serine peptidase [Nitrospirillum sp. BR 11163]